ncbi:restriction endonuclease subunit S [Allobaculum mucilyticum]|nr:restriction endonuclease subunit S [Allobaculum mucilyticum]UNT97121.1 restriction endonuclease subunit S [Allobaculum mucilyticum]
MKTISAENYCINVTDGTHDSPKSQPDGYPLITSKHLGFFTLDKDSANRISEDDYKAIQSRSSVEQWDLLISMIGTVGRVYLETSTNIDYACKNVGIFKMGGDESKAKWLYYYLSSPDGQSQLHSMLRGTTQKYIPLNALRSLSIPVLSDQDDMNEIVGLLWAIDLKIRVNARINKNLSDLDFT